MRTTCGNLQSSFDTSTLRKPARINHMPTQLFCVRPSACMLLNPWQIILTHVRNSTNHVPFSQIVGPRAEHAALLCWCLSHPSAGKARCQSIHADGLFLGTSSATRSLDVSHLQRCTQAVTVTTRTPLRFDRCPLSL